MAYGNLRKKTPFKKILKGKGAAKPKSPVVKRKSPVVKRKSPVKLVIPHTRKELLDMLEKLFEEEGGETSPPKQKSPPKRQKMPVTKKQGKHLREMTKLARMIGKL